MKHQLLFCSLAAIASLSAPVSAATYELRLFNVDDVLNVFITNSSNAKSFVLQDTFPGQSTATFRNISSFVDDSGANNLLTLELTNQGQGYTYGYEFRIDGVTAATDSCGNVNVLGCDANRDVVGLVKRINITFSNAGVSNVTTTTLGAGAVPEPATWAMMIGGFGILGAAARRRTLAKVTYA